MNPIEKVTRSQDHEAPKNSYQKPTLTTFGSVAKLTMSGGHTTGDSSGSHSKV